MSLTCGKQYSSTPLCSHSRLYRFRSIAESFLIHCLITQQPPFSSNLLQPRDLSTWHKSCSRNLLKTPYCSQQRTDLSERAFHLLHRCSFLPQKENGRSDTIMKSLDQKGGKHMRSELTILALWATIYLTGLILTMFLIAVALHILQ